MGEVYYYPPEDQLVLFLPDKPSIIFHEDDDYFLDSISLRYRLNCEAYHLYLGMFDAVFDSVGMIYVGEL